MLSLAMCVFRENTEDIYAGIEWEAGTPEANGSNTGKTR